jgi:hypothetical protein
MPGPKREIIRFKVSVTGPRGVNCGFSTDTGVGPAMIGTKNGPATKGGPKI